MQSKLKQKKAYWKVVTVGKLSKSKKYTVTKSKALNSAQLSEFNLQEMRFLCLYLGMINPKDPRTNRQSFALDDFRAIMELEALPPREVEKAMEGLLKQPITIGAEDGSLEKFPLFCEANLCKTPNGGWAVEIVAFDKAMPLMFMLKDKWQYIKYSMWHALKLKSTNQFRLYEWLKHNEYLAKRGGKNVTLENLKEWLGLKQGAYPEYKVFKRDVLEPCRKAIAEHTDITFEYEVAEKGEHGKTVALRFKVKINPERAQEDQLKLSDYMKTLTSDKITDNTPAETSGDQNKNIASFFDKKKARKGASLQTKFQGAAIQLEEGDIVDIYDLMHDDLMTHEECELYLCWEATAKEFGPEDLKVLRDAALINWRSFDYEPDPYIEKPHERRAAMMAKHMGFWYNVMKKVEADGNITHSSFAYLRTLIQQPMPT